MLRLSQILARAAHSDQRERSIEKTLGAALELAQPRPELFHVAVRAARQAHAERQYQIVPDRLAGDPLIHEAGREFESQIPVRRLAAVHPVLLSREIDDPIAAMRSVDNPPGDDADALRNGR